MGAITVRLTDELQALVDGEVRYGGHASGEAYIQSLLIDEHARRVAALHAAIEEGEASGYSDMTIEQILAEAKQRYNARRA